MLVVKNIQLKLLLVHLNILPSPEKFTIPREDSKFPSVRTLTPLLSEVNTIDGRSHVKQNFTNLNNIRQRNCLLSLYEVYVKATLQYHGGIVFGKSSK